MAKLGGSKGLVVEEASGGGDCQAVGPASATELFVMKDATQLGRQQAWGVQVLSHLSHLIRHVRNNLSPLHRTGRSLPHRAPPRRRRHGHGLPLFDSGQAVVPPLRSAEVEITC